MNEDEDINRVQEILTKIVEYQHTHSGDAVALDALVSAGVLSPDDQTFLESHAIDYKPHSVTDYHAGDMFHIPTDGGCMFVGPSGPPLPKHSARLSELPEVIERVLRMPLPTDALLLHIELTAEDGVGISPGLLCFILHAPEWRSRAETVKSVAAEHGLSPFQDSPELQGNYILSFTPTADPSSLTQIALDLLRRGLGLADDNQITYACGAIEVA
jgi:hypothetical protein